MTSGADPRTLSRPGLTLPWITAGLLVLVGLAVMAYFQPLPVAGLLAVIALVALAWERPFWVFAGLLAVLPFHDQAIRMATWQLGWPAARITLLSLWKEGLIALLFLVMVIQHLNGRRRMRLKVYHFDLWLAALVLLAGAYIVVAANPAIGLFGFRNYFEPLALFFLARLLPYSRQDLKRLLILLTAAAAVVAAYGVFQAQFIDFPTMVAMGYVDEFGNLPFAFKTALRDFQPRPRAISTVTGPNQLAIYLNLFILLVAGVLARQLPPLTRHGKVGVPQGQGGHTPDDAQAAVTSGASGAVTGPDNPSVVGEERGTNRLLLAGLLVLFSVCLLLTFSRGGLLALGVSMMAWVAILVVERGIKRTWRELRSSRWLLPALAALGTIAVAGLVASGFARRIWRGLTGQDPAALGHLTSMDYAFNFIADNLWGIGLGMAGPRALRFVGDAQIEHTESTYLQFGMETGLGGMALLLLLLLSLVATLWRLRQKRKAQGDTGGQILTTVAMVTWVGALAVFTVTPLMQNFLVAGYLWTVAGLAFHLDAYGETNDGG